MRETQRAALARLDPQVDRLCRQSSKAIKAKDLQMNNTELQHAYQLFDALQEKYKRLMNKQHGFNLKSEREAGYTAHDTFQTIIDKTDAATECHMLYHGDASLPVCMEDLREQRKVASSFAGDFEESGTDDTDLAELQARINKLLQDLWARVKDKSPTTTSSKEDDKSESSSSYRFDRIKIELPHYNGEPMKWPAFEDSFYKDGYQ